MKIRGNVVGVPNPQADWNQTDETKANYIRNKPSPVLYTEQNLDSLQQARARENIGAISDNLGGKGLSGVERIAFTDDQGTPHLHIVTALDRNEVPVLALIGSNEEDAPVRIENVADGIDEHNAATVGQLYAAIRDVSVEGGGSSTLVVTIEDEYASILPNAMYAHVQSGGTVVLSHDMYLMPLLNTDGGIAIFGYVDGEETTMVTCTVSDDGYTEWFERELATRDLGTVQAEVGQAVVVESVNGDGKPISWKCVDFPSGSSTMIVTIGDTASHTAAEIYAHVQSGGTAICKASETTFYNLSYVDAGNAIFSFAEDDGYIYGVKVLDNGSFVPIEFSLADAISILPTITAEDNGKFLQAVNGVWVAVDAVPQMQALMGYYIEEKFQPMTQAEYDALEEVDESKYYMIVG